VLDRDSGRIAHRAFLDLPEFLRPGDVLVLNDSRVLPARLRGFNPVTQGQFELLLLEENATNDWWAMLRPGKRARVGAQITLRDLTGAAQAVHATVLEKNADGHARLKFTGTPDLVAMLDRLGEIPLPPYIHRPDTSQMEVDRERYQTVYAKPAGSVAAPTAGLHFTESLLSTLRARGVEICFLTLHVGPGTFAPVKADSLADHVMHEERFQVSEATAGAINAARETGRRIVAAGTTSLRVLETLAAQNAGAIVAGAGRTRIFIYPPYEFKIASALLTNFHLPRSTLLMLASAFASPGQTRGRELILAAYAEAIRERYRFFSYGDAMLLV
jgi:S-adenosylmethionine:tRNA ribosyltransferase-isomerase